MQSKEDLEQFYESPDPWDYRHHPDDKYRRDLIIALLTVFSGSYDRALDIGCGEGFISDYLPAVTVEGIELSDAAAERLGRTKRVKEPTGKYDLITACGVMYKHYDHAQFQKWLFRHSQGVILTCNIKAWETWDIPLENQVFYAEFPYREYTQVLRIFKWT